MQCCSFFFSSLVFTRTKINCVKVYYPFGLNLILIVVINDAIPFWFPFPLVLMKIEIFLSFWFRVLITFPSCFLVLMRTKIAHPLGLNFILIVVVRYMFILFYSCSSSWYLED